MPDRMKFLGTGEQEVDVSSANPVPMAIISGGSGNPAAGPTGSAVPADADYIGFSNSGTLVGVSAVNPLPISGSISATNPSVGTIGAASPLSATLGGMTVGGNLTNFAGTANGLKIDGSAVTQPVSGTVSVTGTVPVSGTITSNAGTGISTVTQTPATSGGDTLFTAAEPGGNNAYAVKSSAGQVYGYDIFNGSAATVYVSFYNAGTGGVTVGSGAVWVTAVPAGGGRNVAFPDGLAFSTAISISVTTTRTGTSAPSASIDISIAYK